jgi:hypothetical protein
MNWYFLEFHYRINLTVRLSVERVAVLKYSVLKLRMQSGKAQRWQRTEAQCGVTLLNETRDK